jgi:YVTN family beta-propeller protein
LRRDTNRRAFITASASAAASAWENESMLTRRSLLLGSAVGLAACARPKAKGFSGYAFIANQEGGAIAAVDLEVFAVARHIHVDGSPTAVAAQPDRGRVYALTPENGTVHEIRIGSLTLTASLGVARRAMTMRLADSRLYVLCRDPRQLVALALDPLRVAWTLPLPAEPVDLEISPDGNTLAVSYGAACILSFIDLAQRKIMPPVATPGDIGGIRFGPFDSTQLIAANLSQRMLSVYHVPSRKLMVNLPLSVRPDHLCFKPDGGELFITGEGMDAVVVVQPYYTPQVDKTVLAGHSPGAMAASAPAGYLFVANSRSGDVSILDLDSKNVVAVTPVGTDPSFIAVTPDNEYALVLNQASGDMAVIRIQNVARAVSEQRRWKKGPLFMLIPVGSKPVSAAIVEI